MKSEFDKNYNTIMLNANYLNNKIAETNYFGEENKIFLKLTNTNHDFIDFEIIFHIIHDLFGTKSI